MTEQLFRQISHTVSGTPIRFYTATSVTAANWATFIANFDRANPRVNNARWRLLMTRTVQRLWTNGGDVVAGGTSTMFRNLYNFVLRTVAPTIEVGIIVAGSRIAPLGSGSRAAAIRVSGNSLSGVATGIRIARSIRGGAGNERMPAPTAWVSDNRIVMAAVPFDMQRCGVQIANPERVWVTDNDILIETADPNADQTRMTQVRNGNFHLIETDGIRLAGAIGRMFTVRGNSMRACRVGVRVDTVAVTGTTATKQWIVADNAVIDAREPYVLDGRCKNRDNLSR